MQSAGHHYQPSYHRQPPPPYFVDPSSQQSPDQPCPSPMFYMHPSAVHHRPLPSHHHPVHHVSTYSVIRDHPMYAGFSNPPTLTTGVHHHSQHMQFQRSTGIPQTVEYVVISSGGASGIPVHDIPAAAAPRCPSANPVPTSIVYTKVDFSQQHPPRTTTAKMVMNEQSSKSFTEIPGTTESSSHHLPPKVSTLEPISNSDSLIQAAEILHKKKKRMRSADRRELKLVSIQRIFPDIQVDLRTWRNNLHHIFYDCSCGVRRPTHDKKSIVTHIQRTHSSKKLKE
eukprot:TRINITY_DN18041_c0_g1_i1.p1 TRINITY_DN18041_c0_g1~~TRINITY_DN18041_c0_g1_i1.p1  ORF type:complete len:283 (+),score=44.52 TRINITY_DN18041_c0_g1_i1:140-988(+)